MSMEKERLIEEYNKRLIFAECERQDEQWLRGALLRISNGTFTCYGQGRHLLQEKKCSWDTIYELLSKINSVDAKILIDVTINDFREVRDEYKEYTLIKNAITEGRIQMDAMLMGNMSVRLFRCLDWNIGDTENYGRWTINLMAYLDKDGSFIKPFFVVDTRM